MIADAIAKEYIQRNKDTIIAGDGTQEFLLGNVQTITIVSQDDMLIGGATETEIRSGENGLKLDSVKSDPTQQGAEYSSDYTVNWDGTTPDSMLPTKGYVDRKSLYNISLGRNGNLNANAYVRGGGNVIHNATRGELITMDSKLEKLLYRVNSTNGTGAFETYNLVIRHLSFNGTL